MAKVIFVLIMAFAVDSIQCGLCVAAARLQASNSLGQRTLTIFRSIHIGRALRAAVLDGRFLRRMVVNHELLLFVGRKQAQIFS